MILLTYSIARDVFVLFFFSLDALVKMSLLKSYCYTAVYMVASFGSWIMAALNFSGLRGGRSKTFLGLQYDPCLVYLLFVSNTAPVFRNMKTLRLICHEVFVFFLLPCVVHHVMLNCVC